MIVCGWVGWREMTGTPRQRREVDPVEVQLQTQLDAFVLQASVSGHILLVHIVIYVKFDYLVKSRFQLHVVSRISERVKERERERESGMLEIAAICALIPTFPSVCRC
jgi:hypothetical protein